MRLLERHQKLILGGSHTPLFKHVVPVDVSPVASWYFEESEVGVFTPRKEFPSVVSPFDATWYEYEIPSRWKIQSDDGSWIFKDLKREHGEHASFGMLVLQEKLPDGYTGKTPEEGKAISGLLSGVRENEGEFPSMPRFKQFISLYVGNRERLIMALTATHYIDEEGKHLGYSIHDLHEVVGGKSEEDVSTFLRCYGYPIYFSTSLMTCKNVRVEERKPSDKIKKKCAKIGTSAMTYRTIIIDSLRKSIATGEHGGGNSVTTALRIAGGHFKDYREGKGLFGKLHGRFWWDSYVKTNGKAISEIRSYKVNP
jgi:hypothetical protein